MTTRKILLLAPMIVMLLSGCAKCEQFQLIQDFRVCSDRGYCGRTADPVEKDGCVTVNNARFCGTYRIIKMQERYVCTKYE